jgi:hypothetical protein
MKGGFPQPQAIQRYHKAKRAPPKKETADVSVKKRKQMFGLRVSYGVRFPRVNVSPTKIYEMPSRSGDYWEDFLEQIVSSAI